MVNEQIRNKDATYIKEREGKSSQNNKSVKTSSLSPFAAISIITLIGLVCVVIDLYLEKE